MHKVVYCLFLYFAVELFADFAVTLYPCNMTDSVIILPPKVLCIETWIIHQLLQVDCQVFWIWIVSQGINERVPWSFDSLKIVAVISLIDPAPSYGNYGTCHSIKKFGCDPIFAQGIFHGQEELVFFGNNIQARPGSPMWLEI